MICLKGKKGQKYIKKNTQRHVSSLQFIMFVIYIHEAFQIDLHLCTITCIYPIKTLTFKSNDTCYKCSRTVTLYFQVCSCSFYIDIEKTHCHSSSVIYNVYQ